MASERSDHAVARDSIPSGEEFYRVYVNQINEAVWRLELDEPMTVDCSAGDQLGHLLQHAFLADCSLAVAQSLGYESAESVIGTRLDSLVADGGPFERDLLEAFIDGGHRLEKFETQHTSAESGEHFYSNFMTGRFENGKLTAISGIRHDVTTEKESERLRAHLAAIVESSDDAIVSKDLDGKILSWNAGAERIFGYSAAEAIGNSILLIIPDHLHVEEQRIIERIRAGEVVRHYETVRRRKDGADLQISLTVSPVRDERGAVIGASKIARDITELKLAERRSRESEELYRALFNSIDEGYCVFEMIFDVDGRPADYRFLEVNPAFEAMTGLRDAVGRTALEMIPGLERHWIETYGAVALTGESVRFTENSPALGRWFDVCAVRVGGADSRKVALVFNNITERRLAEDQLRESEEKFSKAFNSSPLVLTLTSLRTGKLIEVNDTFCKVTGFLRDEAIGRTSDELGLWVRPSDRTDELTAVQGSGELREREYLFQTRDGSQIVGLLSAELIELRGEPCSLTVIQDITERKRAEEMSARYRVLSSRARDIILFVDPDEGRVVDANRVALETYGYTHAELIGLRIHDLRVEERPGLIDRQLGEVDDVGIQFETFHRRKDGSQFPVEVASVRADVGKGRLLISIVRDISERRRNEEIVRQSARQLSFVTDVAPVFLAHCDRDLRFKFVNRSYAARYGLSPEDCVGKTIVEIHGEEALERISPFVDRVLAGEHVEFDVEVTYPLLGTRFVHCSYAPDVDEAGLVTGWVAAVSDITERRKMETAIRGSEAKLLQMADSMPQVVWIAESDGRVTYYNHRVSEFFGVVRHGDVWEWQPMVHEDDLNATDRAWRNAVARHEAYVMEHRIRMLDGSYRWHLSRAFPALDEAGEVVQWYGTATDIDELKRAEEAIRESEQRFRTMANSAPMLVWMSGPDKLCSYFNQTWLDFTGRTMEEEVGSGWLAGIHPDDFVRCNAVFDGAFDAREEFEIEYRLRRFDGDYRWILDKGIPLFTHNGTFRGYIGSSVDVTARREGQEALLRAERRASEEYLELLSRIVPLAQTLGTSRDLLSIYRSLLEFIVASMPCSAFFVSFYDGLSSLRSAAYVWGDGREFDISELAPIRLSEDGGPNARAVFGRRTIVVDHYAEEIKSRPYIVVGDNGRHPGSSLVVPMAVMNRVIGTLEVQAYEDSAFAGEHVIALEMVANLAAVAIENVRLLEVEAEARASAEAANRAKDEFLSVLSHELRTPLNSMLGWTRMLRAGVLDAERSAKAIEVIERNTLLQNNLIEDLLDVSRIISGKMRIDRENVDLAAVFSDTVELLRPFATQKNVELQTANGAGPLVISGDATRIQQIITNLVQNAIKFTNDGGNVTVSLDRRGAFAEIVVRDSGIGISAELLPHIFERFRQADSSTKRAYSGLGLGLAIVKTLVELHGGRLVASSPGRGSGSTFTVSLPLSIAENPGLAADDDAAFMQATRASLEGAQILLVDDDHESLVPLRLFLEKEKGEVVVAHSAAEALDYLGRRNFNFLITDIGMPVSDGYELISRVRQLGREQNAFVTAVALTAYASSDDRRRALSSGFQEHFAKPVDYDELLSALKKYFG